MIPIFLHDGVSLKQPSLALSKRGNEFHKADKNEESVGYGNAAFGNTRFETKPIFIAISIISIGIR